jgi:hypothetical protein
MKTIEKIIEYFGQNEDTFNAAIEELDAYNGYLGDDRYYEMEFLNDSFFGADIMDILNRAYFGHDEDTWTTDAHGNREYGSFNPNREYFHYNGYGNLVSSNYKDYSGFLDEYAINEMLEHRQYIYTIEEDEKLKVLFDMLEEDNEQ